MMAAAVILLAQGVNSLVPEADVCLKAGSGCSADAQTQQIDQYLMGRNLIVFDH